MSEIIIAIYNHGNKRYNPDANILENVTQTMLSTDRTILDNDHTDADDLDKP